MIEMHGLTKAYRTADIETTALSNINLQVNAGEFIAVMGPSGCGKSTLLNVLGMLDSPDSGRYAFNGEDVAGYPESKLAEIRKLNIGFIFQSFNLVDELTVAENVMLPLLIKRCRPQNVTSACSPCWSVSGSPTAPITDRSNFQVASNSGSRSPEPLWRTRSSYWQTSLPVTSTRPMARKCSSC